MQNREVLMPRRITFVDEETGKTFYGTWDYADYATVEGTPLSKETFLTDETAQALGLDSADPTVNEALSALHSKFSTLTPFDIGTVQVFKASADLPMSGWSEKTQTVAVQGVTAANDILVSSAPACATEWTKRGVIASAQSNGIVTFTCVSDPTTDLSANILIMNGTLVGETNVDETT